MSSLRRIYTLPLRMPMIVTAFVLLIASTNLATLLRAHTLVRDTIRTEQASLTVET